MPVFMPWRQQLQALTGRHRGGAAAPSRPADHILLVADGSLYHVGSAERQPLEGEDAPSLARAAAALLRHPAVPGSAGSRGKGRLSRALAGHSGQPTVLLLMPPHSCVATTVTLPGVAPEAVPSALRLQADSLLPGRDGSGETLALAVNPGRDPDALSEVALWMPEARLEALFRAFHDQGLFLAAVMPRSVALASARDEVHVLDADPQGQTLLHWKNGAVRAWQQVSHRDLQQPEFREQWQTLRSEVPEGQLVELQNGAEEARQVPRQPAPAYAFQPSGAVALARRQRSRQRYAMAGAAAAAVLVLAAMPFLWQSVQTTLLESRLADARQAAAGARQSQAEVRAFETDWGALTEFPEQQTGEVLLALQEVISPNVLGAMELQEGYINIEGQSQDPQRLLQELEEHPMFTEVDFASATSNNRYSIDLRLTTVDFAAYYDWYFPEQRRP